MIDKENPNLKGYWIPNYEELARFIVQYEELANYENFYHFKLRLFPNSLIGASFTWYTTLLRNYIRSWQEMERQFHTLFFRAEPEVCIAKLSKVTQRNGETTDLFISWFKKMRNRCKIHMPEIEYMKNGPNRFGH